MAMEMAPQSIVVPRQQKKTALTQGSTVAIIYVFIYFTPYFYPIP